MNTMWHDSISLIQEDDFQFKRKNMKHETHKKKKKKSISEKYLPN